MILFKRSVLLLARAWTNNDGLSKVRNGLWLGKGAPKFICFGCQRDSQRCKTNRPRNCALFFEPDATFAFLERHTIWNFSALPIHGVFRF